MTQVPLTEAMEAVIPTEDDQPEVLVAEIEEEIITLFGFNLAGVASVVEKAEVTIHTLNTIHKFTYHKETK